MNLNKPISIILLIIAVCCTFAGWFTFISPLFSIIGLYLGAVYEYKEGESKLLNRIGWIGNLVHVILSIALLCYLVIDLLYVDGLQ